MRSTTPPAFVLLAALFAAATVKAAEPAKPATAAAKPANAATKPPGGFGQGKGPLLSRAELRDCLERQERVRAQTDTAQKAQAAMQAEKGDFAREDAEIDAALAALDRTSADAVGAYNARVEARSKRIDDFNVRTQAFNTQAEALRADREAFKQACDNRRFDEEDEMAIRNGK